jgi:7-methyl-GTP pyrophosphatase
LFLKSPPSLILASTSVYRRELLARLKIPFECQASRVDESPRFGETALALVARLALAKAQAVASSRPDACVIGSDQVAVLDEPERGETVMGKPGSVASCIDQLLQCSGKSLAFVTAVAVVRRTDAFLCEFIDTTRVAFRDLDRTAIERYVAREAPLDCAGGFKSEGLGISLCDSIDNTDPTALIGLPLVRLTAVLRRLGFELP